MDMTQQAERLDTVPDDTGPTESPARPTRPVHPEIRRATAALRGRPTLPAPTPAVASETGGGRLIVVSNRVAPIAEGKPTAGGLAVGVLDALKSMGGIWFGWSGEISAADAPPSVSESGRIRVATVDLTQQDYDEYYRGFANGTLWPTFHYRVGLSRFDRAEFAGYERVNEKLARLLAPMIGPDDILWIHDYHLIPFAAALRRLGIANRIGFFLHIPFPVTEVFATVPVHRRLTEALLAYDLVGFQIESDRRAFLGHVAALDLAPVTADGQALSGGRTVATGVYPIGVEPERIQHQAEGFVGRRPVRMLKESLQGRRLIMSVDRLDYSKGLLERFLAFESLLEQFPRHHRRVSFLQIAPPSRGDLETYQAIRQNLEREAGRINGRFADLDWNPIRYLNKGYARGVLMGLFRSAEVGFVTSLRDGMNLVAKEYVAAQDPEAPGVLVLSEFAGAARELDAALIVNPHDVTAMADALDRALTMPHEERRARHQHMMEVLKRNDLAAWRDRFLADLTRPAESPAPPTESPAG